MENQEKGKVLVTGKTSKNFENELLNALNDGYRPVSNLVSHNGELVILVGRVIPEQPIAPVEGKTEGKAAKMEMVED